MCGVFGYVGAKADVGPAIVSALKTLEYRGYDSWGLALATNDNLLLDKSTGRINGHAMAYPQSRAGIGHTRWATHGGVTAANAHPHIDEQRRIAVVHNGIIENYVGLKEELVALGHTFSSDTDSEVVVHLVEDELATGRSLAEAVASTFGLLEGYNAVVVLDRESETFVATKRVSPLVLGRGTNGSTVASDAIAMHDHAEELIYLEDDQLAVLSATGIDVLDRASLLPSVSHAVPLAAASDDIALGAHPHFMAKEMSEQPRALRRFVDQATEEITTLSALIKNSERIVLIGSGTAANAAMAGAYLFNAVCGLDVTVVPASEFRYRSAFIDEQCLVIAISQSGETIDVIEAVHTAKARGAKVSAIVNTVNSTLDRLVDTSVHLRSGVEQCVLATKSYTAMLAALLMTAHAVRGDLESGRTAVLEGAAAIEHMLGDVTGIALLKHIGQCIAQREHLFSIGRGVHYASALEAALKIKEVSYVHAEGFAAGELKHGVIALIENETPCLVYAPDDETRVDILSAAAELKSRGGHMIGIGSTPDAVFDEFILVPDAGAATPIVEALPGQMLGYYAALARGNDPDRPRNLAKSVTVK